MSGNLILDYEDNPQRYAEEYKKRKITGTAYLDFRDINQLVKKYVKGTKTLDYGCGSGTSTVFLKSLGLNVTGVDINEHIIKCAREYDAHGNYKIITSANVPADDNTYDLVFSSWVTVHVSMKSELNKIGQEISRILKPNGIFIMVVGCKNRFNRDWLTINTEFEECQTLYSGCRIKTLIKDINACIPGYFWTEEDYKEMIECSNMKILEIHRPLGKDSDGFNWNLEKSLSPVDIYAAKKIDITV